MHQANSKPWVFGLRLRRDDVVKYPVFFGVNILQGLSLKIPVLFKRFLGQLVVIFCSSYCFASLHAFVSL